MAIPLVASLRVFLVSFLLFDILHRPGFVARGEEQSQRSSSSQDEISEQEASLEGEEEGEYDDEYLRKYTLDLDDSENDCRDITDTFMNCTESRERGFCNPNKANEDLMDVREVCPATCGTCGKPPTRTKIWVDVDCYDHAEDIRVYFTNTDPEPDDFVALYPSYVDIRKKKEDTDQAEMWLYACGNVYEKCRSASGGVIFGKRGIAPDWPWFYFPLSPGQYRAALMRYDGSFLAESHVFTAKTKDHSCLWDCKDSVITNAPCYESHETIHVTFENCAARNDDRIAIYAHHIDDSSGKIRGVDEEPLLWLDSCNTQDCMGDVKSAFVSFGSSASRHLLKGREDWPLPPGEYVALLKRIGEGGPHGRDVAQSAVFEVLEEGVSCPSEEEEEEEEEEL